MVLGSLSDSLQNSLDKLRGKKGTLSEEDVEPVIRDIQRALLESDVDIETVQGISDNIKQNALEEDPPAGVTAREHVLNCVYEELVDIVGESTEIPLEPQRILLLGLQGAGKTTSSAKIAWWFEKKGLRSGIVQTDTHRPGAHAQTKQMAERAEVLYSIDENANNAIEQAETGLQDISEADIQIVDTAGRHASEDDLIDEIQSIYDVVQPDLNLLVIDAAMGKEAKRQAVKFNETIGVDGVIISKMDGTAKGGGALTAIDETNTSISFIGTGEGVKDIERFEPNGFISRLLGMGDLRQLSERVERAMHEMDDDDDWEPEEIFEGEFTLYDFNKQIEAMNNMGRLSDVLTRIPGLGSGLLNKLDDDMINMQEENMRTYGIIIDSMTVEEMNDPSIINNSRKERIAKGSGKDIEQIDELLQQYNQMNKIFGQMDSADDIQKIAQRFNMGGKGKSLNPFS